MMDQVELTQATCTADLDAFNRLVLAYQDRVFQQVYWMLGKAETAEAVTQQVFLTAYRELDSYPGRDFCGWVMKIAIRLCLEHYREWKTCPPEIQAVLGLVDLQGMGYAQVAAILEIPISSVRSRLAQGRMQWMGASIQAISQQRKVSSP